MANACQVGTVIKSYRNAPHLAAEFGNEMGHKGLRVNSVEAIVVRLLNSAEIRC